MSWSVISSVVTDRGCVRALNEDAGCIVHPTDARVLLDRGILAVVADGMGGHAAGEIASRLAVETVRATYYAADTASGSAGAALASAVTAANTAVFEHAEAHPDRQGMGTTCVAVALRADQADVVSIGDSRLYLIRAGGIYRMTVDDSAVGDGVRRGLISADAARHHEHRNVLLRALGTHATASLQTWEEPFPLRQGDRFVLCTDGLTELVSDDEILEAARRWPPADLCQELVDLAKARGGFDNVTVAAIGIGLAESAAVSIPATREVEVR